MHVGKWTLKEVIQGVPMRHPTHPMFVHFPIALYPGALVLGILARAQAEPEYGRAATILLALGLGGSVLAAFTGLVDWSGMVRGSTKRRVATRHMLLQITAQALAVVALLLFATTPGIPSSQAMGVLVGAIAVMLVGNWFGGVLVYRMAMRVSGGSAARAAGAGVASQAMTELRRRAQTA